MDNKQTPKTVNGQIMQNLLDEKATSMEVREALRDVNLDNGAEVYNVLKANPDRMNSWIGTLFNRVSLTKILGRIYQNKFKQFNNGKLPFGDTVQEIVVERSERKGFNEHFEGSNGSQENDLIGKKVPRVEMALHQMNYAYKYKVSVSMVELEKAFLKPDGLLSFTSKLILANQDGAEIDAFMDIKNAYIGKQDNSSISVNGNSMSKGLVHTIADLTLDSNSDADTKTKARNQFVSLGSNWTPSKLLEELKTWGEDFEEPSKDYNPYGLTAFTPKTDLMVMLSNRNKSKIEVNAFATAFNIEATKIPYQVLSMKGLGTVTYHNGTSVVTKNILAIVHDKDCIQTWDTFIMAGQFSNVADAYYNSFLHRQGIIANNLFGQCVIITD